MKRLILLIVLVTSICVSVRAVDVRIDGSSPGQVFEGIGAVSAGASSRLLVDYPEPYRSEILDFLFKPRFGASLQHFKMEIGGDMNSTCGTEPSHARTRDEMLHPSRHCLERGYEWIIAREAKKRNKKMMFDVLQWGSPGWFDGGFYSADNAMYVASYIKGMKRYHGINIGYCGLWNEKHLVEPSRSYLVDMLRPTLDSMGLERVKIVGNDMYCSSPKHHKPWSYANELTADSMMRSCVDVLGYHYLVEDATPEALALGIPIWESEASILQGRWENALAFARNTNRNYIRNRAVKALVWCPLDSYYPNVSWNGVGVVGAKTPWCGHYEVRPAVWAIAHTTQFAEPGWRYLDDACGEVSSGMMYVTMKHPSKDLYSMVIVTGESADSISVDVSMTDARCLYLWRSDSCEQFVQLPRLHPHDGIVNVSLSPNSIYTLTNTVGQRKGRAKHQVPRLEKFTDMYCDDFDSYDRDHCTPRYLSDQGGAFEVVTDADGNGMLQQQITDSLICWDPWGPNNPEPFTEAGDVDASNYAVDVDFRILDQGCAKVFGHVSWFESNTAPHGVGLSVWHDGRWHVTVNRRELCSGRVGIKTNEWNHMTLQCGVTEIRAIVNGVVVATLPANGECPQGLWGLGSDWNMVCFDNLSVRPLGK